MCEAYKSIHGRAIVLSLLLLCFASSGSSSTGDSSTANSTQTAIEPAAALAAEIDTLRWQGRYSEALERARELLELRRSDPTAEPYRLVDAQWLVRTMEQASALPNTQRMELAWADRVKADVDQFYAQGRFVEAASLAERQLRIRRRVLGNEHLDVGLVLNDLAEVLRAKGDYAGAEPLSREALSILRRLLGDQHPNVGTSLTNLAYVLQSRGDYAGAEPLLRQALAVFQRFPVDENAFLATSLNNLGVLLYLKGDDAGAEPIMREALSMLRAIFGEEHPYVAQSLSNLGRQLQAHGDYAGAEPLFREALAMLQTLLGEEHPYVAITLNNLALLLRTKGDLVAAEPLLRQSLAMNQRLLGDEHPDLARSLYNLGLLLRDKGDYAGAETLLLEALAMRQRLLGEEHPDAATTLHNFAILRMREGNYGAAESLACEAAAVYERARVRAGSGVERATFAESPYPTLAQLRLELGRTQEAWPAAERALGRALFDLLVTSRQRPLSSGEVAIEDSLRALLGNLERQLTTYQSATARDTTDEMKKLVQETRARLLEVEAVWAGFRAEMATKYPVAEGQAFGLSRVQSALAPDEALIGWLDVKTDEGDRDYPLWGYVIRDQGPVAWRRLDEGTTSAGRSFSREQVESRADAFRRNISRRPRSGDLPQGEAQALYQERLAPLAECLEGVKLLIVVPSSEMLGIPVEALVLNDGGEMVGDRLSVAYIPSATIHTWLREKEGERAAGPLAEQEGELYHGRGARRGARCLAIGDPPFCAEQLAATASDTPRKPISFHASSAEPTFPPTLAFEEPLRGDEDLTARSALAGNRDALQNLRRLPATREEAQAVSGLYGSGSRLLLGPDATEQELARMAAGGELRQFQVLHIATHALVDDGRPENSALILSQIDLPDPLEAAMAGARIYDGCVSAAEILQEWKLEADLVTLSGCQTALGKRVAGEGYIGLAHAFLQAGARSLLVSLWRVEDRSTSMLMQRFYENLLGAYTGKRGSDRKVAAGALPSKVEALREAKAWLRQWRDEEGRRPYVHPFYWAGFVLMGNAN